MRGRRIIVDSSDEEFPDIRQIGSSHTNGNKHARSSTKQPEERLELKTRRPSPVVKSHEFDELSEADSVQEKIIIEDLSGDDGSDFEAARSPGSESDSSTGDLFFERSLPRSFKASGGNPEARKVLRTKARSPSPSAQLLAEASRAQERDDTQESTTKKGPSSRSESTFKNTEGQRRTMRTGLISDLDIYELQAPKSISRPDAKRPITPPSPAPEPKYKTLASPSKKINRIPATPHRPTMDTFWDQEFIDEWNDEHSPKKQLLLPSATPQSPTKKSPAKKGPSQAAIARATKKAFEESKHELADNFLRELDSRITDGRISELSASTGGIRIDWSNRLNTTAGRANWRRETTRRRDAETGAAAAAAAAPTSHRHHASIELAEKVIDDEARLLNVIAHEFCHLASFMISGVTSNPHGREFKAWAARVTAAFGEARGIEVTTRHSYDIDFRYVWGCAGCGVEYKRHSRSINTDRHRCGACKGELRQTKPVPRARPAAESEYQRFMKEQMKVVRLENPGCPMKDIMKLVAGRWSQQEKQKEKGESGDKQPGSTFSSSSSSAAAASTSSQIITGGKKKVESVRRSLNTLTLIDLT
ncbi:hypothetical protein SLS53_002620 [Cytospora paraplurivora]|uniref:SprT-like domain-containing protein n=1 Tax=Cytospora paraplurivora TaxID=2898453 RepID=A0AAN9UDH3_9PEZI